MTELSAMGDFRQGDRVVVLRLDSDEIECHGCYAGQSGPIMFVLPDDDELPDPVEVGADRVLPEKGHRPVGLAWRRSLRTNRGGIMKA
jgi:hypothetical protein